MQGDKADIHRGSKERVGGSLGPLGVSASLLPSWGLQSPCHVSLPVSSHFLLKKASRGAGTILLIMLTVNAFNL